MCLFDAGIFSPIVKFSEAEELLEAKLKTGVSPKTGIFFWIAGSE